MNTKDQEQIDTLHSQDMDLPDEVAIIGNNGFVVFPSMIAPLIVPHKDEDSLIDEAVNGSRMLGIFAFRPTDSNDDVPEDFFDRIYPVGTVAMILKMLKVPDGKSRLLVHGLQRVRIVEATGTADAPKARIEVLPETGLEDELVPTLVTQTRNLLEQVVNKSSLPEDLLIAANNMEDPGRLADLMISNLNLPVNEQQEALELTHVAQRLGRVESLLDRQIEISRLGDRIQTDVKSKIEENQQKYFLREQLKAIKRELGEDPDEVSEHDEIEEKIAKAKMPAEAKKVAEKEHKRLKNISPQSAEYTVSRTYLDWLIDLPWSKKTRDNIDLKKAQKILDEDHFGLEKVKERILEYLAVVKMRKTIKGPILCLVGPPGVGKTSLGRSVARSMGRKFVRISLGGVRDEAEIRGHRRTYIGSMPGRIIKSLKDADSCNPIFMLDEIDKIGSDHRGDPASALLEVLDPEQNYHFVDHYLDVPFDLSRVMFITTANSLETIPGPLLDRMDVIRISGYTLQEKLAIARQYLIPRAVKNAGLRKDQLKWTDEGLTEVIEGYTREAGLRNLERELDAICRKMARRVAEGGRKRMTVDLAHVAEALGPRRMDRDELDARTQQPGVSIGLAWTPTGGDILYIETTSTPGQGKLTVTGQLGDVMRESVQAARTYLHAHCEGLGLKPAVFRGRDLHLHVPAGAIPKDGPSAGVAITVALASLLRGIPVKSRMAMTGEVTIKGAVLPVGGIKEKVLAAHRSGIETLLLPKRNEKDLIDIPSEIREDLSFHFVEHVDQALALALPKKKAARKTSKKATRKTAVKQAPKKSAAKKTAKKTGKKKAVTKRGSSRK